MMLSKCCTQYINIFVKSSSNHRTGKSQSPSYLPGRVELKNVQTMRKLHSSPMLVRLYSKSCMLSFSIMWTKNFQMSKLGLKKAEETEFKLSTFAGSWRKQGIPEKTSTSVLLTTLKLLTVFSSVQLLSRVWPVTHELQHARSPCPSPAPEVYPNPCPLSQWCHPTISSSVIPFSSCLPSIFPSIRVFSSDAVLCITWPKYWSFSFNISPSNEHPGLI